MDNPGRKILIIEDEKILAEMYRDIFAEAGYQSFLALTAEEGVEIVKKEKPDLVLLDILLPKDNGIAFLKKIKEDSQIPLPKVVAFSNYDEPRTRKEAIELGAKAYLLKTDFTPKELVEKVKRYF